MHNVYNDAGGWLAERVGQKVQKLSVDGGFSCPNRDGTVGSGGCTYCNNAAFSPRYLTPTAPPQPYPLQFPRSRETETPVGEGVPNTMDRVLGSGLRVSVAEQIEEGKRFFARKYPHMKYLAYFQTFTATHAPLPKLKALYEEALGCEDVVGLVIGTRPDCISEEIISYLKELQQRAFVMVEYGVESVQDDTLQRINRGHTFACAERAIRLTHEAGIAVGAHFILGLPGEDREACLHQAEVVNGLPIDVLKLHQLQIVRGTRLAEEYARAPFPLFTQDDYVALVAEYLCRLRPDMVVDRFVSQSPSSLLIAPRWGLKNYQFTNLLVNYMEQRGMRQGVALPRPYPVGKGE